MRLFFLFISFVVILTSSLSAAVIVDPNLSMQQPAKAELNAKEKKQKLSAFKKKMKGLLKRDSADDRKILLVILAIIIPPLAVYIHQDELNIKFWVSLILSLCFWIPGVIYSLLVVLDAI